MHARTAVSRLAASMLIVASGAALAQVEIPVRLLKEDGSAGPAAGKVSVTESKFGLVFTPSLSGLPTGLHGFHVHEKPSCDSAQQGGKVVPGGAAGGHYDPKGTKRHGTPWGEEGHLGDLPPLYVDDKGNATNPVLAPRLKMSDIRGRALMIHAGGDNHSDHPEPLGGGKGRIACGVIQ